MINGIVAINLFNATSALDLIVSNFNYSAVRLDAEQLVLGSLNIDTIFIRLVLMADTVNLSNGGVIQIGLNDMFGIINKGKRSMAADREYGITVIGIPVVIIEVRGVIITTSAKIGNMIRRQCVQFRRSVKMYIFLYFRTPLCTHEKIFALNLKRDYRAELAVLIHDSVATEVLSDVLRLVIVARWLFIVLTGVR